MGKIIVSTETIRRIIVIRDVGTSHDAQKIWEEMVANANYADSKIVKQRVNFDSIVSSPAPVNLDDLTLHKLDLMMVN